MSELNTLQETLGYTFLDEGLLRLALTHPSLAHEQNAAVHHNQRLEFLGDAVLQLVLTDELYRKFPEVGEGLLTKARAQLVNRRTLSSQGRRLPLGAHLRLSRGEEATGGRNRASTLADAFEAVIGAVFLDGGWESARDFVLRQFGLLLGELDVIPNLENPKGELQELLQAGSNEPPQYKLQAVSGPDHDRRFESAVYHHGEELGRGQGKSKKEAESHAAEAALAALRRRSSPGADSSPPAPSP